jgi:uroporphyrin-III C-methyltransferase
MSGIGPMDRGQYDGTVLAAVTRLMGAVPRFLPGHVWLVGAGPGDVGQLTLHAVAALAQAEVVVHDALVSPGVLALARPEAERVPAGKRFGKPSAEQTSITEALVALGQTGRRVLRLKGGDPFVFGRGGEEVLGLAQAGVPFRVIPGMTAGLAGLAAALIPATMRGINQAVIFATGHGAESQHAALNWEAMAALDQPIVLYMGAKRIGTIVRRLMAGGLAAETPAAIIRSATTALQTVTVTTLSSLPTALTDGEEELPTLIAIGRIVAMRSRFLGLIETLGPEIAGGAA